MDFHNISFKIDNCIFIMFNYYSACIWPGYVIQKILSLEKGQKRL